MSALDRFDAAWRAQVPALALASPAPSSATGSAASLSTDDYTPSGSASPVSTFRDEPAEQPLKEQVKQQPARRTVHKISPLADFTPGRVLAFAKPAATTVGFTLPQQQPQHFQPQKQQLRFQPPLQQPAPHQLPPQQPASQQQPAPATKPVPFDTALLREISPSAGAAAKAADSSTPVPIPGALQDSLGRSRSLIKAVPAKVPTPVAIKRNTQSGWPAQGDAPVEPAAGSWAERQARFALDRPSQQPGGLSEALKARNAAVKARRAASLQTAKAPAPPEEVAWRIRFKRKWIKEELFARRLEFPDDPTYDDEWESAQRFLEECGPDAALQAAFLQTAPAATAPEADDEGLLEDAILFPDDESLLLSPGAPGLAASRSGSAEAEVAAKAAALVRLHRKIAAAA